MAETVAAADFYPTCGTTVTLDWYTDELTGWDVHDACGTALVDPGRPTILTWAPTGSTCPGGSRSVCCPWPASATAAPVPAQSTRRRGHPVSTSKPVWALAAATSSGDHPFMTQNAPMPPDLRRWVGEYLPCVSEVTDVSWPRGNSRVWRVASDTGEAFVKLSPSTQDYEREVCGYAYAARALAPHEAPRLLGADPDLQAIMTSPLPGRVVRGLPLEIEEERRVHELAGHLLRRWHNHSAPAPHHHREMIRASLADQADEAAACLDHTAGHLDDDQRALVQGVSWELPRLAEDLPIVYRHGDYSTRNWLWDRQEGHGVIDFAMSGPGIAVEEFVWLCGAVWVPRPDLKAAYLAGYGRALSETEERVLRLLTTRLGISYLHSGLTKHKPVLVERGKLVLTRMTHEYQ